MSVTEVTGIKNNLLNMVIRLTSRGSQVQSLQRPPLKSLIFYEIIGFFEFSQLISFTIFLHRKLQNPMGYLWELCGAITLHSNTWRTGT